MVFEGLVSNDDLLIYNELSKFALELGYIEKRAKTIDVIYIFSHPITKERILKFSYSSKRGFVVHLKFNKSTNYTHFFHEAIRRTIEESNFKYTGCYAHCDKCDGTLGYTYRYPNNSEYFRCYQELIELFDITLNEMSEVKSLLLNQV